MKRETKPRSTRDIEIDGNWISIGGTAAVLFLTGALAIWQAFRLLSGGTPERVSLTTVIFAAYSLVFAFSFKAKLFKLAFFLMGIQAGVRAILSYVHASSALAHLTTLSGLLLLAGLIILIIAVIEWFKSVLYKIPTPEDPAS